MKENKITEILEIGTELISKKGFNNVGLQEILATANIPKGSFYYYFKSKEDFGLQIIKHYSAQSILLLDSYLKDNEKTPKERFLSFFKGMKQVYEQKSFSEGCLLGNCSLELADLKSSYALGISKELNNWQNKFEQCILEGQEDGSIKNEAPASKLAAYLLNNWEGALLRMKTSKSAEAIDIFIDFTRDLLD